MNKKLSLKNLNLKEVQQLSRAQLRDVLGGYTGGTGGTEDDGITTAASLCYDGASCSYAEAGTGTVTGECETNSAGKCVCNAGSSSVIHQPCKVTVS